MKPPSRPPMQSRPLTTPKAQPIPSASAAAAVAAVAAAARTKLVWPVATSNRTKARMMNPPTKPTMPRFPQ
ncbi:hypothetical protein D3C72_1715560 [compost metagenome]